MSKYIEVLNPFMLMMNAELEKNSSKGDRPAWLKMTSNEVMLEIYWHAAKLQKAVADSNGSLIAEHAADVANCSMMMVDVCGAWPPAKAAAEVDEAFRKEYRKFEGPAGGDVIAIARGLLIQAANRLSDLGQTQISEPLFAAYNASFPPSKFDPIKNVCTTEESRKPWQGRGWINAPSSHSSYHKFHGEHVIVGPVYGDDGTHRVAYRLPPESVDNMIVSVNVLERGWPCAVWMGDEVVQAGPKQVPVGNGIVMSRNEMNDGLITKTKRIAELEREVKLLTAERNCADENSQHWRQCLKKANQRGHELRKERRRLNQAIESYIEDIAKMAAREEELARQLNNSIKNNETLHGNWLALSGNVAGYETQLASTERVRKRVDLLLTNNNKVNEELSNEVKRLNKEVKQLNRDYAELHSRFEDMTRFRDNLAKQRDKLVDANRAIIAAYGTSPANLPTDGLE